MNVSCVRSTFVVLALLTACVSPERITVVDAPMPLEAHADGQPYVVRLVDDLSGEPVAGAAVVRVPDGATAGEAIERVLASSDHEGFVRMPASPPWAEHVVRLAGGGVVAVADLGPVWRVGRAGEAKAAGPGSAAGAVDGGEPPALRSLQVQLRHMPSRDIAWGPTEVGPWSRLYNLERTVELPSRGPGEFWLRDQTADQESVRRFAFPETRDLVEPLLLEWPPGVQVAGRAVDGAGTPVPVLVRWRALEGDEGAAAAPRPRTFPDGGFHMPGEVAGMALLEVAPVDEALRGRRLLVPVPERGATSRVELGDVRVGGPAPLVVRDASGKRRRGAAVGWQRAGWQAAGITADWPLDARGEWLGPDLQAGDGIVVPASSDRVAFRTVLAGAGPWELQLPAGQLALAITDARGAPLPATVTWRDDHAVAAAGELLLRGLPCGRLRLYVGAAGHRSAVVDADVDTTARTLRIVLPESP